MRIKKNELIKKYLLLSLIYKGDGRLLTISELFQKRKEMINDDISLFELNKIYEYIFNSYQVIIDRDTMFIEIISYLEGCNYSDMFALKVLENFNQPRKIMTQEELDNNIKKRLLSFRKRYSV